MVGNMVTSDVSNNQTLLQIALRVVIREKTNIELLHGLGISLPLMRFYMSKSSTANAAARNKELRISKSDAGLVQVVADSFDANIASNQLSCFNHPSYTATTVSKAIMSNDINVESKMHCGQISTTFMRYRHSTSGIVGITLQPSTLSDEMGT